MCTQQTHDNHKQIVDNGVKWVILCTVTWPISDVSNMLIMYQYILHTTLTIRITSWVVNGGSWHLYNEQYLKHSGSTGMGIAVVSNGNIFYIQILTICTPGIPTTSIFYFTITISTFIT